MKRSVILVVVLLVSIVISLHAYAISTCTTITATSSLTQDVSSAGTCMSITGSNLIFDCQGYTITYDTSGGSGSEGIVVSGDNVTVKNCNVNSGNDAGSSGNAVSFNTNAQAGTATNNTIDITGGFGRIGMRLQGGGTNASGNAIYVNKTLLTGSYSYGILSFTGSDIISNNYITVTGQTYGLYLSQPTNVTASHNTITHLSDPGGFSSLILNNAGQNTIINTTIVHRTTAGSSTPVVLVGTSARDNVLRDAAIDVTGITGVYGAYMYGGSRQNSISDLRVNANGSSGVYGIYLGNSCVNNTLSNITNITASTAEIYIETTATGTIFDNVQVPLQITNTNIAAQSGKLLLRFLDPITATISNIADVIIFDPNSVYVNTTAVPEFNISAEITLSSTIITEPIIYVSYTDGGNVEICPVDLCTEISNSGGLFVFNVTHFTTFSISSTPPVPEFSTIALFAILGLVLSGFVMMRRQ